MTTFHYLLFLTLPKQYKGVPPSILLSLSLTQMNSISKQPILKGHKDLTRLRKLENFPEASLFMYLSIYYILFCVSSNRSVLTALLSIFSIHYPIPFCLSNSLPHCDVRDHDCLYSWKHHLKHGGLRLFTSTANKIKLPFFSPVLLCLGSVPF